MTPRELALLLLRHGWTPAPNVEFPPEDEHPARHRKRRNEAPAKRCVQEVLRLGVPS